MAQRFDVPARLAEGREALAHTDVYVSACQLRGYSHSDLTSHIAQVRDWYDGEDGMDLWLLDDDCGQLWAAVEAADEALREQRAQIGALAAAWRGPGADAAVGFLQCHCDGGAVLTAGLRAAAEACTALRDNLWRLIDDKVRAAVDIDDRSAAQRPQWLAAAHAVMAGGDQREGVADVIDRQVKPYVDTDIGGYWLNAMRSARAAVAAAYDAAAAAAAPGPGPAFPIPGELGPRYQPDQPDPLIPPAPVGPVAPLVAAAPAEPGPLPAPDRWVADSLAAKPFDEADGWPADAGSPGELGAPTGAGGLSGLRGGLLPRLAGGIADALGGLLGSPDGGSADPVFGGEQLDGEPEPDDAAEPVAEVDKTESEPRSGEPPDDTAGEPRGITADALAGSPTEAEVAQPVDLQTATPPPDGSAPPATAAEKTPCEIAADELPQVGR